MSTTPHERARRVVALAFFTVFLDLVGFGIIIPFFPLYVKSLGGDGVMAGVIITCFALTQFIATPILGGLSDRYGRRPVILVSLAGNALSMLFFALAVKLGLLWLLFASRITAGATAGNIAACQAAIADVTTADDRTKGMGRLGAGIGLGLALGPWIGGVLSEIGPWAPPLAAGALALADLAGVLFVMPETHTARGVVTGAKRGGSFRDAIATAGVPLVLALYFSTFLYMSNLNVSLPLLAHARIGWEPKQIGRIFGMFGAIMIVVQGLLIGRMTRIFGAKRIVVGGSMASGAGLLLIASGYTSFSVTAGLGLLGLGLGVVNPCLSTIASERAAGGRMGEILGFAQSSGGAARTVGPVLSGFLYEHVSTGAPFYLGAGSAMVAVLLALLVRPVTSAPPTQAAPSPPAPAPTSPPTP